MLFIELLNRNERGDILIGLLSHEIDNRFPPRCTARFRNFMNLEPVTSALVGEEQDIVVCGRNEHMFDEIVFLRRRPGHASSAAPLAPVSGNRKALDESPVADCD